MKLFLTIFAALIFVTVHGRILPVDDIAPVDDPVVCTLQYVICPPGQQRIVNGCQQSCVPCGAISLPYCTRGYIARLNPPAENTCPSYSCVPVIIRPPIRPPIKILPVEPYPIYTLPYEPAVPY